MSRFASDPVKLYLVRHAKAMKRVRWEGRDRLRPLSPAGQEQSMAIAELLGRAPIDRIISSPFLRCRQTVEPLAAARNLPVEIDERLGEGENPAKALELIHELSDPTAALSAHGDLILALLCDLEESGMRIEGELHSEKGSVWVVEGASAVPERASYIAPGERGRGALARALGADPEEVESAAAEDESEDARLAVLDLGSTSFHLLVAEASADGELRRLGRDRAMLRLGAAVAANGRIPEATCEAAVEQACRLRRVAFRTGAERLLPVATSALRDAENGRELADRISRAIDAPVRLLSGEEEARIIFGAFRRRVSLGSGMSLGVDLGGGSLELAAGDADAVAWETTLPLGVTRLHRELVHADPMPGKTAKAIRERVSSRLALLRRRLACERPDASVATGGTMRALARMVIERRGLRPTRSINELFVSRDELDALAEVLVGSSLDERLAMPGIQRRRADLLPTGCLVLATLARELGLDGYTVCDWGLREGVILEALGLSAPDRGAS